MATNTRLTPVQIDRATGALLGTAAGDALGAGYEFGPPLPEATEVAMIGGGGFGWEPGEWTDDTSMAIPIAHALAAGHSLDDPATLDGIVAAWQRWMREATDVGNQTRAVLGGLGEPTAARAIAAAHSYHEHTGQSGGNGSLMRTAPVALGYLGDRQEVALAAAARRVSQLTHWDEDAGDACALWCLAIRHAIRTGQLDLAGQVRWLPEHRQNVWKTRIAEAEADPPQKFAHNGWVVEAFQGAWSAIWHGAHAAGDARPAAARVVDTVERAVRGGRDTDTVAAIAGALVGATSGGSAVPARWRRILHGWPGLHATDLTRLAVLAARGGHPDADGWPEADRFEPHVGWLDTLVTHPHDSEVLLASLAGLDRLPPDVDAVVSLCRVGRKQTPHEHVEFWLVDEPGENADPDGVLTDAADTVAALRAEGRRVAVHCAEGRSRTSAVAALYATRHRGVPLADAWYDLKRTLPHFAPAAFLREAVARVAG